MSGSRTPAAMEMTSALSSRRRGPSAAATRRSTWGLTASTTTEAPVTASPLSLQTSMEKRPVSSARRSARGSATRISDGGHPPATNPPTRLAAMLPPPMNAMTCLLMAAPSRKSARG